VRETVLSAGESTSARSVAWSAAAEYHAGTTNLHPSLGGELAEELALPACSPARRTRHDYSPIETAEGHSRAKERGGARTFLFFSPPLLFFFFPFFFFFSLLTRTLNGERHQYPVRRGGAPTVLLINGSSKDARCGPPGRIPAVRSGTVRYDLPGSAARGLSRRGRRSTTMVGSPSNPTRTARHPAGIRTGPVIVVARASATQVARARRRASIKTKFATGALTPAARLGA